jgi:hypothetical protein
MITGIHRRRGLRLHPTALAFVLIGTLSGLVGCDRSTPKAASTMTTEEIIRRNADAPVGQSIVPVATSLAKHSVIVATESSPRTQPTTVTLDKLHFRTDQDNQGRMWAYAYTTQAELSRSFPKGTPYVELKFQDFFQIIQRDGKFAGIFLNSGSDASYPIPHEVFEKVKEILRRPADGTPRTATDRPG